MSINIILLLLIAATIYYASKRDNYTDRRVDKLEEMVEALNHDLIEKIEFEEVKLAQKRSDRSKK